MIDRERLLAKLDELDGYLRELRSIAPAELEQYQMVEKKRACERLLQVSVEAVIDFCALLVAELRLGLPGAEDDLFEKLLHRGVISTATTTVLMRMKGLRDLLVHEYGRMNDEIVYETVRDRLGDFDGFKRGILAWLRDPPAPR